MRSYVEKVRDSYPGVYKGIGSRDACSGAVCSFAAGARETRSFGRLNSFGGFLDRAGPVPVR